MRKISVILLLAARLIAQQGNTTTIGGGAAPPVGVSQCSLIQLFNDYTNGNFYFCDARTGTWTKFATAGGFVPITRLINTTAPLGGGGDLSADRTLTCTTCATTTNGGALSATAPIAISVGGVISITSPLPLTNGGTNASLVADLGAIPYSTASAMAFLASTATANKILLSGTSAAPTWSVPTFPNASATLGKYIKSDGTNWIASTGSGSGVGTPTVCTNQVVTAFTLASDTAPTSVCNTVTSAYTSGTFPATAHNLFSATHGDTVVASPVLGDIPYGNVTPAWTKLAGNITTTKKFFTQTGTGAVSAVPAWLQPAAADLSDGTSGTGAVALVGTPTFTTSIKTPAITVPADSITAFRLFKANGSTVILDVDTTNSWVGFGTAAPNSLLSNTAVTIDDGITGQAITGITWLVNSVGPVATLYNSNNVGASHGLLVKTLNTASTTYLLDLRSGTGASGGTSRFYVRADGVITLSGLTASLPTCTDASKNLISCAVTGTGTTSVLSAAPTLTGLAVMTGLQSAGTKFTVSGCSADTTIGGATEGTFVSRSTATCTFIITINGATGLTATNGWNCFAVDSTTPLDIITQNATSSTTTCTVVGPTTTGDLIRFSARAF